MSQEKSPSVKEKFYRGLSAATIATIGLVGLAACGDKVEAKPTVSTAPAEKTESPKKEEKSPFVTEVPRFKDDWNYDPVKLEAFGKLAENRTYGDPELEEQRAIVCTEFLNNNMPGGAPQLDRLSSGAEINEAYDNMVELARQWNSDENREMLITLANTPEKERDALELPDPYTGVRACVSNWLPDDLNIRDNVFDEHMPQYYLGEEGLAKDSPIPEISTVLVDGYPTQDHVSKFRHVKVEVAVGDEEPQIVHRRFHYTTMWNLVAEQRESPFDLKEPWPNQKEIIVE